MSAFQSFEAISTAVFIVMGIAVGLRLLLLARQTGQLPELTLGGGLFLIVGVGYPVFIAAAHVQGLSLGSARVLGAVAAVVMNAGWWLICLFNWRVFRPEERWARGVGVGFSIALAVITLARFADLAGASDRARMFLHSPSLFATQLFALALYVWTGIEALVCHARLKRQLALGLIEPVVVNRVLLWAVVAAFCFASMAIGFVAMLLRVSPEQMVTVRLLMSLAGLGCGVALYLAFFPPRAYLRRVAGATA